MGSGERTPCTLIKMSHPFVIFVITWSGLLNENHLNNLPAFVDMELIMTLQMRNLQCGTRIYITVSYAVPIQEHLIKHDILFFCAVRSLKILMLIMLRDLF